MKSSLVLALCVLCLGVAVAQTPLTTEVVASGLQKPSWAGQPPGDSARLFVVQQHVANVIIIDLETGLQLPTPFLDLSAKVLTHAGERGLLGMAFDPAYATTRFSYVYYTRVPDGALVIERYTTMPNDPDRAIPGSGVVIFGPISHPDSNHNGGHIVFGPDGKLWLSIGDGGGDGDTGPGHFEPGGNSQYGLTPLGKLLRMNKDGSVPGDNPFVGDFNYMARIWATGLRNPWRFSFDRETGDLWIADVGENTWEEIDFAPASSNGGENYGWRCMEGFDCTGLGGCECTSSTLTRPIHVYGHDGTTCAITGGVVYRGDAIPDLAGSYFFADYCSFQVWSLRYDGSTVTELKDRTSELETPGFPQVQWVASFAEDSSGEIYIVDQNDEVFRIVPAGPFTGLGHALPGVLGKPVLHGEGTLLPGSPGSLELTSARPFSPAMLFASVGVGPGVPFKGGSMLAVPYVIGLSMVIGPSGNLNLSWSALPSGLPPGLSICFQYAIFDPVAPADVALSNALRADVP